MPESLFDKIWSSHAIIEPWIAGGLRRASAV